MKGKQIVMPAKRSATLEDFELDEVPLHLTKSY